MRHLQRGTTLVELLVVVCLIVLMCTLGMTGLMPCREQNERKLAHKQLIQALHYAIQTAHFKGEDVGLCYADENNQCRATASQKILIFIDSEHHGRIEHPQQRLRQWVITQHAQLFFRSYPNYRHYLLFAASHMQRNDNATLWYCDASHHPQWAVVLSQSGRMITRYPTADGTVRDREGKVLQCDHMIMVAPLKLAHFLGGSVNTGGYSRSKTSVFENDAL